MFSLSYTSGLGITQPVSDYLHEVCFQQTLTGLNVMAAHQAKVVGLCPVQGRRIAPDAVDTLCNAVLLA